MPFRTIIVVFFVSVATMVGFINGCRDSGSQPTNPAPPSFGVSPTSVSLTVGDSSVLSISGGTTPYTVVDTGNTSVATASITGTSLRIRAVGTGSSTVIIGDNGTPQLRDSLLVNVTTPVSFANQVQPIFTASCVNAGCHPGGGAPFSLRQQDNSYQHLVDALAISPCLGLTLRVKRASADSSILYKRIIGNTCFSQMPLGLPALDTASQSLIRNWINQGANP